jgi:hypothetical protein
VPGVAVGVAAGALAHDELDGAGSAPLRLQILEEHVEQVVPHPVDHELARVGERELVAFERDRADGFEVGLEGVAREAGAQPFDGWTPQLGGRPLGVSP